MTDEKIAELEKRIEELELLAVIKHIQGLGVGTEKGTLMRMLDEGLEVKLTPVREDGRVFVRTETVPAEPAVKVTEKPDPRRKNPPTKKTFARELAALINRHNIESQSDTPDYVLADYLIDCLDAWARMSRTIRDKHLPTFTGKI